MRSGKLSIAARVTRHCVPIFLPLRSPESRLARTSASSTPSTFATWAGVMSSGVPAAVGAGAATPGVVCAMSPPVWFIICCAIAMPTAISAAIPPAPPPPFSSPCAIWNLT